MLALNGKNIAHVKTNRNGSCKQSTTQVNYVHILSTKLHNSTPTHDKMLKENKDGWELPQLDKEHL